MPYKSLAQERYFNANRDKLEAQGVNVDEWNQASKGKLLPNKVPKPPKTPKMVKVPKQMKAPKVAKPPKTPQPMPAMHSPLMKMLGLHPSPTPKMHPLLKGPR